MPPSRRHRSCANLVRERELNTCQSNQHVVRARAVFHKTRSREARAHTAVLPHNRATCGGFWPLLEHQPQPHQLPSVTSVLLRALSRHALHWRPLHIYAGLRHYERRNGAGGAGDELARLECGEQTMSWRDSNAGSPLHHASELGHAGVCHARSCACVSAGSAGVMM